MTSYAASYSGPSVGDFLANPPYPNFDLASVYNVATAVHRHPVRLRRRDAGRLRLLRLRHVRVRAVRRRACRTPPRARARWAPASHEADAQPGDLVIMPGHDGFYAGNGQILHAPVRGGIRSRAADLDERLLHRAYRYLSREHRAYATHEWRAGGDPARHSCFTLDTLTNREPGRGSRWSRRAAPIPRMRARSSTSGAAVSRARSGRTRRRALSS